MADRPRPHRDPDNDLHWVHDPGRCSRCGDPLGAGKIREGMHADPGRDCYGVHERRRDYWKLGTGTCYLASPWRFWDPCRGPIQKDHVVRLADNGSHDLILPACEHHHARKTAKENASARERRAARKAAQERTHAMRKVLAVALLALAGYDGLRWWWLGSYAPWDQQAWVWWCALQAAALTVLAVLVWRWRAHRGRLDLIRIELANDADSPLEKTKVHRARYESDQLAELDVTFAQTANVARDDERARFRNILTMRFGGTWDCVWSGRPGRDPIRMRAHRGDAQAAGTGPSGTAEQAVHLALSTVLTKGEYRVNVTATDDEGPTRVEVMYPGNEPDDDDRWRAKVVGRVGSKLPGRWKAEKWDTQGNLAVLARRPKLPTLIEHPADAARSATRLPFGLAENRQTAVWDTRTAPHMLVVGVTGFGKTVVISTLLTESLAAGRKVVLIDGKGSILAGFRHWPGVIRHGLGEAADMAASIEEVEELMRSRYRAVIDEDRDPASFDPITVIIDEAAEFAINIKKWWAREGKPKGGPSTAPAIDSWQSIARLGRECQINLIIGIQQAAASFFGSTEPRDNLPARIGCGRLSQQGAMAAFGSGQIGRDIPLELKGRMTVQVGDDSDGFEVQGWWTPTPRPSGAIPDEHRAILNPLYAAALAAHPTHQPAQTGAPS